MANRGKMRTTRITKIVDETQAVKTYYFKDPDFSGLFRIGTCFMIWVPGVGEAPFGISGGNGKGEFSVTVEKKGKVTSAMHEMKEGDLIGIKGPFGNGFDFPGGENIWVVTGGVGSAPFGAIAPEMTKGELKVILGTRTASDLIFEERFRSRGLDVTVATDDDSQGYNGFVTECFREMLGTGKPDLVLTCGPEIMMVKVVEICKANGIRVQASLERYMKCGMGICDVCSINGLQVCRDGPVFEGKQLEQMSEWGRKKRDAAGKLVNL